LTAGMQLQQDAAVSLERSLQTGEPGIMAGCLRPRSCFFSLA
jgi:hypothetical protein